MSLKIGDTALLNRIYYVQKRAVRATTNSVYRAHSRLAVLDAFQVNFFHVAKFMFYYHNKLLPPTFQDLFVASSQVQSYGT